MNGSIFFSKTGTKRCDFCKIDSLIIRLYTKSCIFGAVVRSDSDGIVSPRASRNAKWFNSCDNKAKKETSNEISFFVVRSTGIEDVRQYKKALIFKAFLR